MDAMTARDFLMLESRNFANGNVRDAIYAALKEREELIKKKLKVNRKFTVSTSYVETKTKDLIQYMRRRGWKTGLEHEYKREIMARLKELDDLKARLSDVKFSVA